MMILLPSRTFAIPRRCRGALGSVRACRFTSAWALSHNNHDQRYAHSGARIQQGLGVRRRKLQLQLEDRTISSSRSPRRCYEQQRPFSSSVSSEEVDKFSGMDRDWWDPAKNPLISMNAIRVQYILQQLGRRRDSQNDAGQQQQQQQSLPLHGLTALDIGCGGGLLSESLARLGCRRVTGLDPSKALVRQAQQHAAATLDAQAAQRLNYHGGMTAEEYLQRALLEKEEANDDDISLFSRSFDIVCLLEVVEHATDVSSLLQTACSLLSSDGGMLFVSTMNRTVKSHLLTIVGAEYIMGYVPTGTHDWQQYQSPAELEEQLRLAAAAAAADSNDDGYTMETVDVSGMVLSGPPLMGNWDWKLDPNDTDVNWIGAYRKTRAKNKP